MLTRTTIRSPGAIVLACAFLGGTGYVLFADLLAGASVTPAHVLTVLAMLAATASGHQCLPTLRQGRVVIGAGLILLFAVSLGYIAIMSGARNAEVAATKADRAGAHNSRRDHARDLADKAEAELVTAKAVKAQAVTAAAIECASGPGTLCKGRTATVATASGLAEAANSHALVMRAKFDLLGPEQHANAGYAQSAAVLAVLTGGNAQAIEQGLVLVMPYIAVLITELGAIVYLSLGLGHASRAPRTPHTPPTGGTPLRLCQPPQDHRYLAVVRAARRPLTNDEIAAELGVSKGEASTLRKEVEHLLAVRRAGRYLQIELRAAA
jgi:hypothetical protein